ncbi:MAG: hypothetical protein DRP74_03940 [Candidatus Omnitrophota bacterium]|nr:MAG: hypothetical protein DRP74_03940 [Candidatus Omnitrophota bacterium]
MSIIYDALKKVEKDVSKGQDFKEQKPSARYKIYLLYGLVLFAGIFAALAIFRFVSSTAEKKIASSNETPSTISIASSGVPQQALPAPSEGPMAVTRLLQKPLPSLVLNGIFFAKDGAYALINNRIVRKGGEIEGAKVESITSNSVELSYAGETFTLSTIPD